MMNDQAVTSRNGPTGLSLWKTALYVVWILVKLTLILAVLNRNTVEFIYAGF